MRYQSSVSDPIAEELRLIRQNVPGVRASLSTECGQLKEVITRGTDGYVAVYAAGGPVIVAVLGTSQLNVAMLN